MTWNQRDRGNTKEIKSYFDQYMWLQRKKQQQHPQAPASAWAGFSFLVHSLLILSDSATQDILDVASVYVLSGEVLWVAGFVWLKEIASKKNAPDPKICFSRRVGGRRGKENGERASSYSCLFTSLRGSRTLSNKKRNVDGQIRIPMGRETRKCGRLGRIGTEIHPRILAFQFLPMWRKILAPCSL